MGQRKYHYDHEGSQAKSPTLVVFIVLSSTRSEMTFAIRYLNESYRALQRRVMTPSSRSPAPTES